MNIRWVSPLRSSTRGPFLTCRADRWNWSANSHWPALAWYVQNTSNWKRLPPLKMNEFLPPNRDHLERKWPWFLFEHVRFFGGQGIIKVDHLPALEHWKKLHLFISINIHSLKLNTQSPGHPKRKIHLPTIDFPGLCHVNVFREGREPRKKTKHLAFHYTGSWIGILIIVGGFNPFEKY